MLTVLFRFRCSKAKNEDTVNIPTQSLQKKDRTGKKKKKAAAAKEESDDDEKDEADKDSQESGDEDKDSEDEEEKPKKSVKIALSHKEKKELKKKAKLEAEMERITKKGGEGHSELSANFTVSQALKTGGALTQMETAVDIKVDKFRYAAIPQTGVTFPILNIVKDW